MLKSSFRLFSIVTRNTFSTSAAKNYGLLANNNLFGFCKTTKHGSNETHRHEDLKQKRKHENEAKEEEVQEEVEIEKQKKQAEHQAHHDCRDHDHSKHDHKHHGEDHKTPKSEHEHLHHHQKLSKMSFEELVELKTEEGMKYAHHIYEHEVHRLKEIRDEKIHLKKNLEFYQKLEEEIKEKEAKLIENIKNAEEEMGLSKKRAEKEVAESKAFAVTKIAKELLEVADCVANCKKYAEQSEIQDKYTEEVVRSQVILRDILKKFEIEEFDPVNQEYDPNTQESLLQIPTPPGCQVNHVALTMRTGYTIKGRLLRSARVGIFS